MKLVELRAGEEIRLVEEHLIYGALEKTPPGLEFYTQLIDECFKAQVTCRTRGVLPVCRDRRCDHHEVPHEQSECFAEDEILLLQAIELTGETIKTPEDGMPTQRVGRRGEIGFQRIVDDRAYALPRARRER